jgi:hypothetical protein
VERGGGGGRCKPHVFKVLAPPTEEEEEEENSSGTKGDVRELGNCSAFRILHMHIKKFWIIADADAHKAKGT